MLAKQDKLDEAMASYQQALRLKPNYPEAHSNLGNALQEQGRLDEAVASCQQALRLKPDSAEAHHNLGLVLAKQDKLDEAVASFQQTLRLKPDYPDAHNNLGIVLEKQDKLDEAMASYQQALRLKPDYPEAHNNLGIVLEKQGRLDEAVACYQQALRLKPDYPEAHWNRSLAWLLMGRFEQGWPGYEWRWKCKEFGSLPPFHPPLWDGSPLDGRTILVHAEQGLGDTLQFIRYAPLVHQRGGRVILVCQPPLIGLLTRSPGVERLVAQGEALPEYDVHVPLMSLPGLLGTTLESVPADVPYLDAEPQLVEAWRHRLGSYPGFKVGIVWQGNPKFRLDRLRSIPLAQFAPLARVPGVHLFSLQKGPGAEQLAAVTDRFPVTDLGRRLDDFMDTAAVLKNLDLVISVDTAIAHLAGALGIPVWVALPFAPDWRWLMDREDSPWYPTMRLFRQTRPGQWEDVFQRIAEALQRRLAAPAELRPITVEIAPGELIDKITILEIKSERITDAAKRHHVGTELALLVAARDRAVPGSAELARLATELKAVNEARWQVEDEIRLCERDEDFGPRFVALVCWSIAPTIGVPPSSARSMSCSVPSSSKRSHTRTMRRGSSESGGARGSGGNRSGRSGVFRGHQESSGPGEIQCQGKSSVGASFLPGNPVSERKSGVGASFLPEKMNRHRITPTGRRSARDRLPQLSRFSVPDTFFSLEDPVPVTGRGLGAHSQVDQGSLKPTDPLPCRCLVAAQTGHAELVRAARVQRQEEDWLGRQIIRWRRFRIAVIRTEDRVDHVALEHWGCDGRSFEENEVSAPGFVLVDHSQ